MKQKIEAQTGLVSYVQCKESEERVMIVTAPDILPGYWSTAILRMIKMESFNTGKDKVIPDIHNPIEWYPVYGIIDAVSCHECACRIMRNRIHTMSRS